LCSLWNIKSRLRNGRPSIKLILAHDPDFIHLGTLHFG
jgi:hypothetical protein